MGDTFRRRFGLPSLSPISGIRTHLSEQFPSTIISSVSVKKEERGWEKNSELRLFFIKRRREARGNSPVADFGEVWRLLCGAKKGNRGAPLRGSEVLFFLFTLLCAVIPLYDHIFPLTSLFLSFFRFRRDRVAAAADNPPPFVLLCAIYRGLISIAPLSDSNPTGTPPRSSISSSPPLFRLHSFTARDAIPIFPRLFVDEGLHAVIFRFPSLPVFASSFKPVS